MSTPTYPKTPELDKMLSVKDKSQPIGEFLEWCDEQGYELCELGKYEQFHPLRKSINSMLAAYFGLDERKMEAERRAVLDYAREIQGA